jgi:hypothetical protein
VVQALLAAAAEVQPDRHVGPHPLQYVAQLAAKHNNSKHADVVAAELMVESAAAISG